MDMVIEAAPMTAGAEMTPVVAEGVQTEVIFQAILAVSQVASIPCPSIAGTSISAVSPDYELIGGTALAAA